MSMIVDLKPIKKQFLNAKEFLEVSESERGNINFVRLRQHSSKFSDISKPANFAEYEVTYKRPIYKHQRDVQAR